MKGSYFLEEQQQLQDERDIFKEQKRAFEVERKNFTEAAIRLGWEVDVMMAAFLLEDLEQIFHHIG